MPATRSDTNAATQETTALIPLSMSLVAKKEKILKIEKEKLEKHLRERTKLLCGLSENHEHLLKTNGHLQERNRLRKEKLLSLRMELEDEQSLKGTNKSTVCGTTELEAIAEKCGMLKDLLDALAKKHVALEQSCMNLEERTSRETSTLAVKKERLNEARDTLLFQQEEIRSVQWSYEMEKAELANAEMYLNVVSQNAQQQSTSLKDSEAAARTELANLQDVQMIMQNYQEMAQEELRHVTTANKSAKSTQQELRKMLESNGATCPEDDEVLEASKDLESRLQHLNNETTATQYIRRELALRTKQESGILAITQSTIKAKDEQLTWLERQRVHLANEQKEMMETYAGDEAAYNEFLASHTKEMDTLAAEIEDVEKQAKAAERSIPAREKKVVAINKKTAQKKRVLGSWNEKNREKQEQLARSTATKTLVDSEELGLQEALKREQLGLESIMQQNAVREMEAEDLLSSCVSLEANIRQANKTLPIMKSNIAAAETSVKNRIDEIRDKFLNSFVISDSGNLIELLNKEVQAWSKKDTDKFDTLEAAYNNKAKKLKQQYDDLLASARSKYSKILQQKEKQYNAKLATLKTRTARKNKMDPSASPAPREKDSMESSTLPNQASTMTIGLGDSGNRGVLPQAQESETSLAEFDPPWLDGQSNESALVTVSNMKQRSSVSSKPKQGQRKAKAALNQVPKSVRRELMSGLNLVGELSMTDNKLLHSVTVDAALTAADNVRAMDSAPAYSQQTDAGARRPRLQKRTAAQKAGKVAKTLERKQSIAATTTPLGVAISAEIKRPTPSFPSTPDASSDAKVTTWGTSEDPIDSPIGCDDTIELCRPTQDAAKTILTKKTLDHPPDTATTKSTATKGSAKTRPKQVDQRGKNYTKRSTAKVSRGRHSKTIKARRISLASQGARAMDWSTADTFSFA